MQIFAAIEPHYSPNLPHTRRTLGKCVTALFVALKRCLWALYSVRWDRARDKENESDHIQMWFV